MNYVMLCQHSIDHLSLFSCLYSLFVFVISSFRPGIDDANDDSCRSIGTKRSIPGQRNGREGKHGLHAMKVLHVEAF